MSSTNHPLGCQNKFGFRDSVPYLCKRQFCQTQNLFHMLHSTTQRKKAQMASALFNDVQFLSFEAVRNTAEWDAMSCDEQMRLEDLIGSAQ